GEERMRDRPLRGAGVVVTRIRLTEAGRVGHEPPRIDLLEVGRRARAHDLARERQRSQGHQRAWAVAPEASIASISAWPKPASRSTSRLCSPRRGWSRRMSPGVLL